MNKNKWNGVWLDLMSRDPFSAAILLNCRTVFDDTVKTMCTDGDTLWVAPSCVETETSSGLLTMLAHEAMHVASLHPYRQAERDIKPWNIACDREINNLLDQINESAGRPLYVWPTAYPSAVKIDKADRGKPAEEMYVAPIKDRPGNDGNRDGDDNDQPGWGDVKQPPGDINEKEAQKKIQIVQAAQAAKQQGKLPASMERLIDAMLNPPSRWQDLLRNFIRERCKDDYAWTRPNPRYLASGFILPSLHSQRLGRIAVAIDTSGSIDATLLNTFMAEVEGIMHECRPEKVILIDCDAQVNSITELEPTDTLPRKFKGGGGTSHEPVWAALENDPPICCICLTDMETTFGDDPGFPVIWGSYGTRKAPFGEVVQIK